MSSIPSFTLQDLVQNISYCANLAENISYFMNLIENIYFSTNLATNNPYFN